MIPDVPIRLLLGPQRPICNLAEAITRGGIPDGTLAVISAGWQEGEGDIDDVQEIVARPVVDLRLYHRAESLFEAVPALGDAHRKRQDRLKDLQRLYRLRLKQQALAARQVFGASGEPDMLAAEQRHAIAQLRALDRHHLHGTESVHRHFEREFSTGNCSELAAHVQEIAAILDSASAVLITGGNVIVLLNRMRLFGLATLLQQRHVIAWSAGAMALAGRVVLFHDRTPQGRRDPEILGAGCSLLPGFVFLPDTKRRLRQKDRLRVGLFSRRFSPELCVALDSGSSLLLDGLQPAQATEARRLQHDGRVTKLRAG